MVSIRRISYTFLVAALAIAPNCGCSEAPPPPKEVKEAGEEAGTPPKIELGSEEESKESPTDSPEKKGTE